MRIGGFKLNNGVYGLPLQGKYEAVCWTGQMARVPMVIVDLQPMPGWEFAQLVRDGVTVDVLHARKGTHVTRECVVYRCNKAQRANTLTICESKTFEAGEAVEWEDDEAWGDEPEPEPQPQLQPWNPFDEPSHVIARAQVTPPLTPNASVPDTTEPVPYMRALAQTMYEEAIANLDKYIAEEKVRYASDRAAAIARAYDEARATAEDEKQIAIAACIASLKAEQQQAHIAAHKRLYEKAQLREAETDKKLAAAALLNEESVKRVQSALNLEAMFEEKNKLAASEFQASMKRTRDEMVENARKDCRLIIANAQIESDRINADAQKRLKVANAAKMDPRAQSILDKNPDLVRMIKDMASKDVAITATNIHAWATHALKKHASRNGSK